MFPLVKTKKFFFLSQDAVKAAGGGALTARQSMVDAAGGAGPVFMAATIGRGQEMLSTIFAAES